MTYEAQPSGAGTGSRIAIALGIGCGGLILLAILTFGAVGYWAFAPGTQVPTDAVIAESSAGYVRIGDLSESAEAVSFVVEAAQRLERASPSQDADLQNLLNELRRDSTGAGFFLPRSVSLALEPDPLGGTSYVGAMNPAMLVRPARAVVEALAEDGSVASDLHRGVELYSGDLGTFGFVDGTVVFASSFDGASAAVDRLLDLPEGEAPVRSLFDPEGDWLATGSIPADAVAATSVIAETCAPAVVRFAFRLESSDVLRGFAETPCSVAGQVDRSAELLGQTLAALGAELSPAEVATESAPTADGNGIRTEIEVRNLLAAIEAAAAEDEAPMPSEDGDPMDLEDGELQDDPELSPEDGDAPVE